MGQGENLLVGIIIGATAFYFINKKFSGFLFARRMHKAKQAERKALELLEGQGYKVIGYQEPASMITYLDGQPSEHRIQADYIVKRDGKKYVVEVKSGQNAPRISQAKTRRQLLEYYLCYNSDGILLVNMENKTIQEVDFEINGHRRRFSCLKTGYFIILLIGIIVGYIIVSKQLF